MLWLSSEATNYPAIFARTHVHSARSVAVADPRVDDDMTNAIRTLNEIVRDDEDVLPSLLPISDGLTVAYKLK